MIVVIGCQQMLNIHPKLASAYNRFLITIPSPIFILVFFALKTLNILCTEVSCGYYILCAVKSKKQIFNFGEGIVIKKGIP